MKTLNKFLISIIFIVTMLTIAGCSVNYGDNPTNNGTPPGNIEIPPDNEISPPDNSGNQPPLVTYDTLIKVNAYSIYLYQSKSTSSKKIGSVNKGDMLPLITTHTGYYETVFNYQRAYVKIDNSVSIAKFEHGSEKVERLIEETKKLIGIPYVYGAERYHWGNGVLNPQFSKYKFDCSSLTQYVYYLSNNVLLKTTSREQSLQGKYVEKNDIKRGDLMFFTNSSRQHLTGVDRIGHVAIYFGDNYIIHTASDYCIIEPISATRWGYYITTRRFL